MHYIDITNKWRCNSFNKPFLYNIGDSFIFKKIKYKFDNHHVKYNFKEQEIEIAFWLARRINKRIKIIPDIEYPLGIKHSDYIIGRKYFDLKTIYGNSNQAIYHKIRHNQEQADNFIIYIHNNSDLSINDLRKQIDYIYKSNNPDRNWVNIIIIIYKRKFFVYQKKSVTPHAEVVEITDL